jgi:hypothetical protein
VGLQVHPELRTIAEVEAQAERGVSGAASTIGNDVGDPVCRNPKCLRELIFAKGRTPPEISALSFRQGLLQQILSQPSLPPFSGSPRFEHHVLCH